MKRAFTLIELLVVVAIMGILGTVAAVGYRGMQRGIEERGAMQNVNQFIRSAYQRAQIDRLPVAIFFWNETRREETEDEPPVVVGRAIAVRRAGRFSKVQGSYLCDEFGDLRFNCSDTEREQSGTAEQAATAEGNGMYLYAMNGNEGSQAKRVLVGQTTERYPLDELLLLGSPDNGRSQRTVEIDCYAYVMTSGGGGNWTPVAGDAYGFEFADIELPQNFIFGKTWSTSLSSPVSGEDVIRFRVSANSGSGATDGKDGKDTILVSCLRPDESGALTAKEVATSDSPTKSMY